MSWRKGSTGSNDTSAGSNISRGGVITKPEYPFALALRIRVVQIVCGIAEIVMGSVAAIEEREQINLSLGVPAGAITVLAAGWSVHRSVHRDAGGRRGGAWGSKVLWTGACALQGALLALSMRTVLFRHQHGEDYASNTSVALAAIHGTLSLCALSACLAAARIRFIYGCAPAIPPPRSSNCPRSTSHTGVSMVPLASNFNYPAISDLYNKSTDNLSSENEMLEISISENRPGSCEPESSPAKKDVNNPQSSPKVAKPSPLKATNDENATKKEAVSQMCYLSKVLNSPKDTKCEPVKLSENNDNVKDNHVDSCERRINGKDSNRETYKQICI